jgi:hypothetical protein
VQTNEATGNRVVAFRRSEDGALELLATVPAATTVG